MEKIALSASGFAGLWLMLTLLVTQPSLLIAQSIEAPYLLLQGPSGKTHRFYVGDVLEWKVGNDKEWFKAPLIDMYPETGAIRINDWILQSSQVSGMRFPKSERIIRRKNYFRFQGLLNVVSFGGGYLISSELREFQGGFLLGLTGPSIGMVLYGALGRYHNIDLRNNDRYVLMVTGGPILPEPENTY